MSYSVGFFHNSTACSAQSSIQLDPSTAGVDLDLGCIGLRQFRELGQYTHVGRFIRNLGESALLKKDLTRGAFIQFNRNEIVLARLEDR